MAISIDNEDLSTVKDATESRSRVFLEKWGESFRNFGRSVKSAELIFFTSQLSLMLEIGTSLNKALKAIALQTENPVFRVVIEDMHQVIEEGRPLSDAMRKHPRVFDTIFVSMIKAGETGGFFKDNLGRIVEMQEKRQKMIAQIKAALTYPAVLCGIGFLAGVFVMGGGLP